MTPDPLRGVTNKEARAVLRAAREQGCRITITRSSHIRIDTPNGPYFTGLTASRDSSARNLRAGLRQKGVNV